MATRKMTYDDELYRLLALARKATNVDARRKIIRKAIQRLKEMPDEDS